MVLKRYMLCVQIVFVYQINVMKMLRSKQNLNGYVMLLKSLCKWALYSVSQIILTAIIK